MGGPWLLRHRGRLLRWRLHLNLLRRRHRSRCPCGWYYAVVLPVSMPLVTRTVKLPKPMAAALSRMAKKRGCSESELIRTGIEQVTLGDEGVDMLKFVGPSVGVGRGPSDLSSNRKRLSGYGRSRNR